MYRGGKPPLRTASATIWRAKGKSRRGHSIMTAGWIWSAGMFSSAEHARVRHLEGEEHVALDLGVALELEFDLEVGFGELRRVDVHLDVDLGSLTLLGLQGARRVRILEGEIFVYCARALIVGTSPCGMPPPLPFAAGESAMRIILLDRPARPARVVSAGAAGSRCGTAQTEAPLTRASSLDKRAGVALAAAAPATHIGSGVAHGTDTTGSLRTRWSDMSRQDHARLAGAAPRTT